ncbi:GerAB/ArcD/ProY family transporter [Paenibacillus gorillae]|uniref:GerAB/ArcD/ProY family transporter n=1 Tax=Paenibacillus gorillae TaxID=1243662 RepID=UPI0004BCA83B|nr:endospore germination permease [Paenibacillus gorillae]
MKQPERVSSIQMSMLFLFFMTGSSIVIVPAPLTSIAGNGAWISLLIATAIGMLLLAAILYLNRLAPELSLVGQSQAALGKGLTLLVLIPFTFVLTWNISGVVIEIGIFFKNTMLKETPTYAVSTLFFIMIGFTAMAGIEVIARMAAVFMFLMFGCIVMIWILVANLYHPQYLLPIMPDGMGPILNASYVVYGFPYSELVVFSVILAFVRKDENAQLRKHMYIALIINSLTLIASVISSIMVLGPLSGNLKYSLYQLARLISFQEVIERIESVIGFSLIVGFYFKASILLLILIKLLKELLGLKNERLIVFPATFICLLLSLTTYIKESQLEEFVNVTWPLLNTLAYTVPVLLILAVTAIRFHSNQDKKQ